MALDFLDASTTPHPAPIPAHVTPEDQASDSGRTPRLTSSHLLSLVSHHTSACPPNPLLGDMSSDTASNLASEGADLSLSHLSRHPLLSSSTPRNKGSLILWSSPDLQACLSPRHLSSVPGSGLPSPIGCLSRDPILST